MVLPLGPVKFYGSSLPRPRYYTDVKFSDERVDPPVPLLDPLLSWANEAHWSMGGLSMKRLRLQGKIEGNVEKLRKEKEKILKKKSPLISTPVFKSKGKSSSRGGKGGRRSVDSPPPAPVSRKLKLRSRMVGGEEDEGVEEVVRKEGDGGEGKKKRRRLVRKLGDDFEMVADENVKTKSSPLKDVSNGGVSMSVASRTRGGRRVMVLREEEEESDSDVDLVCKTKKGVDENGETTGNNTEEIGSVSGKTVKKKSGEKGSVSPNGTRSSPRLKQISS